MRHPDLALPRETHPANFPKGSSAHISFMCKTQIGIGRASDSHQAVILISVRAMNLSIRGGLSGAIVALFLLWAPAAHATTVRVHYDTGFGDRIAIRGSAAPLSWTSGKDASWTTGNVWVASWPDAAGDVDVKPLINDTRWSTGGNYRVRAGTTVDIYPFFGPSTGRLVKVTNFWSPQLGNGRTLVIYLPPSYSENLTKRYPVLYMHDGQNLFEAATSAFGTEWRVDENINAAVGAGRMDEVIVVGVANTGNRIWEYTPCCDATYGGGGADSYERFLIDTVKPYVDASLRTLPGKDNTGVMGSSLGGLLSFYLARRNPSVFAKAGCLSSSFWWNDEALTVAVEQSTAHVPVTIYLDAGTSSDGLPQTTRMDGALLADGYVHGRDLRFYAAQGGSHNEASWAARVRVPLEFLFPWQSTAY
jgi:predicted alpha/beta superfamily hydrolase